MQHTTSQGNVFHQPRPRTRRRSVLEEGGVLRRRRPVDEIVTCSCKHEVEDQHYSYPYSYLGSAEDDNDADSFFLGDADCADGASAASPPSASSTTAGSTSCSSSNSSTAAESTFQAAFAERTAEDMAQVVAWWDRYYCHHSLRAEEERGVAAEHPLEQEACLAGNCMVAPPDGDTDEHNGCEEEEADKDTMLPDDTISPRRAADGNGTTPPACNWKRALCAASCELFHNEWHWTAQIVLLCLGCNDANNEDPSGLWWMVVFYWALSVLQGTRKEAITIQG